MKSLHFSIPEQTLNEKLGRKKKQPSNRGRRWRQWQRAGPFGYWWWHRCRTRSRPGPAARTWTVPGWRRRWEVETHPLRCPSKSTRKDKRRFSFIRPEHRPLPRLTCGITKNQMLQNPLAKVRNVLVKSHKNLSRTEVKSEDDSGLETLWLLKKMAFLSENRRKQKCKSAIQYSTHRYCIYSL